MSLPAQTPPPFSTQCLLKAKRVFGFVQPPIDNVKTDAESTAKEDGQLVAPPPSQRTSSTRDGNILVIDHPNGSKAYLLQRKIGSSLHGSVRIGFALKYPKEEEDPWEIAKGDNLLVTIKVENKSQEDNAQDPMAEISALQLIAAYDPEMKGHVMGTSIVGADYKNIYVVTPFHYEGSLFDYCSEAGRLCENDARFFFLQILQALETLQSVELCHRSITLETLQMRGNTCDLVDLGSALRIPTSDDSNVLHLIEPQPTCGMTNPQFVAPELLKDEPFDGYAIDLWAAGIILFIMLLGNDGPLFAAPLPEDRKFKEISIRANLKVVLQRWNENNQHKHAVSDDARDLLQKMLRAEPKDRLSLAQVRQHAWVVGSK